MSEQCTARQAFALILVLDVLRRLINHDALRAPRAKGFRHICQLAITKREVNAPEESSVVGCV